ncbi:hypothetical protein B0H65DRAFT_551164 [Neurospora tetraspora]|uniref:Uncharacterized protein n=1 Tax=Neurospora tetraspora TaxID=94610 RepID=A0AAE0JBP2_9PEZI|nr:hypothetical protein B0H65DRAFT_551164 [Neurospora tetraspora]
MRPLRSRRAHLDRNGQSADCTRDAIWVIFGAALLLPHWLADPTRRWESAGGFPIPFDQSTPSSSSGLQAT